MGKDGLDFVFIGWWESETAGEVDGTKEIQVVRSSSNFCNAL